MRNIKKILGAILICSLALMMSACQNSGGADSSPPSSDGEALIFDEGIVADKNDEGNRVLVTQVQENDGNVSVRAAWLKVTEITQITDSQGNPISMADIQVGDRAEVWNSGAMAESYPEQGEASKIALLPESDEIPSGWISRQEAVKAVLDANASSESVLGIAEAAADEEMEQWSVKLVASQNPEQKQILNVDAKSGEIIHAQNGAFKIFEPVPSSEVGSSFVVKGKARVFEGAFSWHLEDGHNILDEGHATAEAGAPEWGSFEFTVDYETASNPVLILYLYVNSAKDGKPEHELHIPLKPKEGLVQYPQ